MTPTSRCHALGYLLGFFAATVLGAGCGTFGPQGPGADDDTPQPSAPEIPRYATSGAPRDTAEIAVDLGRALYPFGGIGWNVNAATFSEQSWPRIRDNLDSMGMQMARVILHPEFWHPTADRFVVDSGQMKALTRFLQYCDEKGITVWLHNWWSGGKYDEQTQWPHHGFWLANSCHNDPTNQAGTWAHRPCASCDVQGPETDHPFSDDVFAQVVTRVVSYWIKERGIRSIAYLGLWNEPNGAWAYQPRPIGNNVPTSYIEGMNRLYDKVWWYKTFGNAALGEVQLVGSDMALVPGDEGNSMGDIGAMLRSWQGGRRVDDFVDAVSFHSYVDDYGALTQRTRAQIRDNNFDGTIEKVLIGEIGKTTGALDMSTARGRMAHSVDCARKIIGNAKQGAYAVLRWWFSGNDVYAATDPSATRVVPETFNPVKLFANTLPQGTDAHVMQTTVTSSHRNAGDFFDAVTFSFWDARAGRNRSVIWIVNQSLGGARHVSVRFAGLQGAKRFRKRLVVTSDHFGYAAQIFDYGNNLTVSLANPRFEDDLWGQSVQVYVEE